jgi:putative ATP-binding cassette transporter
MAPRFVVLDRMDGDLSQEQVAELYHLLKEAAISYLSVGDHHNLLAYHDTVLEILGEGRWQTAPARPPDVVDGLLVPSSTQSAVSRQ